MKHRFRLTILLAAITTAILSAKQPAIDLQMTPTYGSGPTTVHALITIETHYQNSALCLDWESDIGQSGTHCWTVEGQYAPHQQTFELKNLPEGRYTFVAQLYRAPTWYASEPRLVAID